MNNETIVKAAKIAPWCDLNLDFMAIEKLINELEVIHSNKKRNIQIQYTTLTYENLKRLESNRGGTNGKIEGALRLMFDLSKVSGWKKSMHGQKIKTVDYYKLLAIKNAHLDDKPTYKKFKFTV